MREYLSYILKYHKKFQLLYSILACVLSTMYRIVTLF